MTVQILATSDVKLFVCLFPALGTCHNGIVLLRRREETGSTACVTDLGPR